MVETWREHDLRGVEAVPGSVSGVVRHARVGLTAVRLAESVLLLAAAGCLTLAAAALSGTALDSLDVWIVAALGGLCAGGAWWLEHRVDDARVARLIDRRLRHHGGLVSAFETERRGDDTPIARWLQRRVRTRLRRREALKAVLPSLALPVAIPLAAAFVLALALRASRAPQPTTDVELGFLAAGASTELAEAAALAFSTTEVLDGESVRTLARLGQRARELERSLRKLPKKDPGHPSAAAKLERLDDELARLQPALAPVPALARRIDAARAWLDGARMGLEVGADPPAETGAPTGSLGPTDRGDGGAAATRAGGGGAGLAPAAPDGTMARSNSSGSPVSGASSTAVSPESGTTAGRWWPPEHDLVVSRWIEARRRALMGAAPRD